MFQLWKIHVFLSFFFFFFTRREGNIFFKWGWHLNWDYKISHLHMRCRKTSTHRKFVQVMEIEISRFFVSFCFVLFWANGWVQFSSVQSLSRVRLIATPWIVARQSSLLLLLLLSRLSRVRLCMTPETAANQASPSLGFSWQEHWSGLPFPSPMHESEKWSRSVMSNSSDPMDCSPPGSSVHGIFQAKVLEWDAIAFSARPPYSSPTPEFTQTQVHWVSDAIQPSHPLSSPSSPPFSLSSFTFIKRLSAIRVVSSAYLRLLIFLPAILIPVCVSSSPAFLLPGQVSPPTPPPLARNLHTVIHISGGTNLHSYQQCTSQ